MQQIRKLTNLFEQALSHIATVVDDTVARGLRDSFSSCSTLKYMDSAASSCAVFSWSCKAMRRQPCANSTALQRHALQLGKHNPLLRLVLPFAIRITGLAHLVGLEE